MASSHRSPAPDLVEDLNSFGEYYSFFRAVDILRKLTRHEIVESQLSEQDPGNIMFKVHPGLGFPASDIHNIDISVDASEQVIKRCDITVTFLGLHGSSSPLPNYILDSAVHSPQQEEIQKNFLDFFNHRLLWLMYLSFRKYRYYLRYKPRAEDQFSKWMFSLFGLNDAKIRGDTEIPWTKMLSYVGLIATRSRSAFVTAGIIKHAFQLSKVEVQECVLRKVEIEPEQRMQLGKANCQLGSNSVIGKWIQDRTGKFVIELHDLEFTKFQEFLPSGNNFKPLKQLIAFLLKDQFAYSLKLNLKKLNAPNLVLGAPDKALLGWTSFLGEESITGNDLRSVEIVARG